MSIPMKKSISCPQCGQSVPHIMWGSINSNEEKAAQRIINGDLFAVKCENCGFSFRAYYTFLFNDMVHGYFLWYCQEKELDKILESCRDAPVRCRVSTDILRMREKTAIIDAGLDDRIIEIMKVFVQIEAGKQNGKEPEEVFFLPNDGTPYYELVTDGQVSFARVAEGSYEFVKNKYGDFFDDFDKETIFVDEEWVEQFLTFYRNAVK